MTINVPKAQMAGLASTLMIQPITTTWIDIIAVLS